MARDSHISAVRKIAAQKRQLSVEKAKTGEFAPPKQPANGEQAPTVTVPVSDSASTIEEEPPKPPTVALALVAPKKGHRRRNGHRTTEEIRKALGEERGKWWDAFWEVFPCHESPNAGMDAFERRVTTRELAIEIFHGAQRYAKQIAADRTLKIKYAQGWINAERWKDECRVVVNGKPPGKLSLNERTEALWAERIAKGENPI
jgi:hypothetical protein